MEAEEFLLRKKRRGAIECGLPLFVSALNSSRAAAFDIHSTLPQKRHPHSNKRRPEKPASPSGPTASEIGLEARQKRSRLPAGFYFFNGE
jgi:hypothetical protein